MAYEHPEHKQHIDFLAGNVLHLAALTSSVENLLHGTRDHAFALQVVALTAKHGVCLAAACLSVGKNGDLNNALCETCDVWRVTCDV